MLILITGSAGFVGTNLTKRLLAQGHSIIGVDNFITALPNNAEIFKDNPNYEFFEHDVCNDFTSILEKSNLLKLKTKNQPVRRSFSKGGKLKTINQIYHLASMADPKRVVAEPLITIRTNTVGMVNVLDLAKQFNATFLQASTSEIYGEPQVHPQPETYYGNVNTVDPRAGYNESKRLTETLCYSYRVKHNVNTKIIRIFNTYGPHMNPSDGRVISHFIIRALKGESLPIYGDGSQTRSFQYIDDLIDGMIKLMNTPPDFMGPVNIGNPHEFTILELAEQVLKKIPPPGISNNLTVEQFNNRLVYLPLGQGDPLRRCPDISLAKQILNWGPKINLSAGLDQTIAYFKSYV